jgi:hypothetical protein
MEESIKSMHVIDATGKIFRKDDIVAVRLFRGNMDGTTFYVFGKIIDIRQDEVVVDTSKEYMRSTANLKFKDISEITLLEKINLCNYCTQEIPTCRNTNIEYGTGVGNDNVIKCDGFINK